MGERQDDRFKMVFEQEKDDDYQIAFLKSVYGETKGLTVVTTLDDKQKTAKKKKMGVQIKKQSSRNLLKLLSRP